MAEVWADVDRLRALFVQATLLHLDRGEEKAEALANQVVGSLQDSLRVVPGLHPELDHQGSHNDQQTANEGLDDVPQRAAYVSFYLELFVVKQTLDKGNVEYAGQKAASVRTLHRTSVDITHAGGKHSPIEPKHILGGILATTSGWSPAFGDAFLASLQERSALETIDIGCCTDAGGFVVANHRGDGAIEHSPPELALAFFFLRLLQELQQIGTVPAMDYSAYLEGMGV